MKRKMPNYVIALFGIGFVACCVYNLTLSLVSKNAKSRLVNSSEVAINKKMRLVNRNEFRWTDGHVFANRSFGKQWTSLLTILGLGENSMRQNENGKKSSSNEKTIIVTGFSSNHFEDGTAMLNSIEEYTVRFSRTCFVYVYDLGLNDTMIKRLGQKFGHFIEIRRFQFDRYPDYVSQLLEFRWKPLIVAEIYAETEHGNFWWFDTSVRIRNDGDLFWYYQDYLVEKGHRPFRYPLTLTHYTSHSIFAATSPALYDYFPINETLAKKTDMYGATVFHLFKSPKVTGQILKWWVLCALEKDCMAPPRSGLDCYFAPAPNRDLVYAMCHRYDQSVLNVLMAVANDYDSKRYFRDRPLAAIQVERTQ